jgi:hypothetical protein
MRAGGVAQMKTEGDEFLSIPLDLLHDFVVNLVFFHARLLVNQ